MKIDFDRFWTCGVPLGTRCVKLQKYNESTDEMDGPTLTVTAFPAGGETDALVDSGDVEVNNRDRIWHLRAKELRGTAVGTRDWIIDTDGSKWVVVSAQNQTFGTRWRCICKRVRSGSSD